MVHTRSGTRNRVTPREFYAQRLCIKGDIDGRRNYNCLFHCGKLTQQYIVDAFVKIESNNLEFLRRNQTKLRVDLYTGLKESLENQAREANVPLGNMFILPSTYQVYIHLIKLIFIFKY